MPYHDPYLFEIALLHCVKDITVFDFHSNFYIIYPVHAANLLCYLPDLHFRS